VQLQSDVARVTAQCRRLGTGPGNSVAAHPLDICQVIAVMFGTCAADCCLNPVLKSYQGAMHFRHLSQASSVRRKPPDIDYGADAT
jgi:hypothetical protein